MADRNVRARMLVTRNVSGTPGPESKLTLWWLGDRFHVRDEAGRAFHDVATDVVAPRGLGFIPRTIEDLMNVRLPLKGRMDCFGALGVAEGTITEPWGEKWKARTDRISPVAGQLFPAGLESVRPSGHERFLNRDCVEYTTHREGTDGGRQYRSKVRLLVAGPYVLLREVTDEGGPMRLRAEVTALDEGVVTEADVKA
ncbi:hypothetical protein [Phytomonospora endophytica]|uniref:Uncharacterized protein n=1 Tax=Phytomonospora endophytica TaxID=714109 RepID=A0A841FHZ8_9ACTN|nr:hypothetical protein [Phytomonospora endophytica]MBB6036971.1 hypothetical protein [Phytomonospora endophytica]GIG67998.1 hypothetical protein Pen01_42930 [Phytomonospora endophytica]